MPQAPYRSRPRSHPVTPWDQAVGQFLADKRGENLAESTLSLYDNDLRGTRATTWRRDHGVTTPTDLTAERLRLLAVELRDAGLSPASAHRVHRVFKTFARWAVDQGYEIDERVLTLKAPRQPRRHPDAYSKEQERLILGATAHPRDRAFIEFLRDTGLRLSEALHVRLDDFDEGMTYLRVRQGKGRKDRIVPLERSVARRIGHYIRHVRPTDTDRAELFLTLTRRPHEDYRPIDPQSIKVMNARITQRLRAQGIRNLTAGAHRWRHTFGTRAADEGRDSLDIRDVMGHASLASTEQYIRSSPEQIKRRWLLRRAG